jgi:hypothetical protein
MKNILVPTDLSLQSLNIIHEIISNEKEKVNIHLIHMVQHPNEITELLYKRKSHLYEYVPDSFTEAVQVLRNKYLSQINNIILSFYYGNRVAVLNNIIESNKINAVYLLANHQYKLPLKSSVSMVPLIKRCKLPVEMVYYKGSVFSQSQPGSFSALLANRHTDVHFAEKNKEEVYN